MIKNIQIIKQEIQSAVDIYKSRNLVEAEKITRNLIHKNPKIVFLYNLLGLILTDQKRIDEAIESYKNGLSIDPNYAMIYNNLGYLFYAFKSGDNIKKAEEYYNKSISLDKKIPEPHNNLGNLYKHLKKFKEAIKSYKTAININPKLHLVHNNLGNTYVSLGEFDLAKDYFNEAIKISPNFGLAHRSLSRIKKYTNKDKHFHELIDAYKNTNNKKDKGNKLEISFALGKAYEDIKDFRESFKFYKEANDIYRSMIKFSIKDEKKKFDDFKEIFKKDLFKKYEGSGFLKSSPIFIVGLPRSGTTLVEQILSSHPKVYGAGEITIIPELINQKFGNKNLSLFFDGVVDFDPKSFEKLGQDYVRRVDLISNNSKIVTDKLPINFFYIGLIKLILPKAKIIHIQRGSKDNCLSIYKNHFPSGLIKFAYDLKEIVDYNNLYNDIMNHWQKILPNFIYNIKYENLISKTEFEIKGLLKFCNLQWDDSCLNFHKNTRPVHTASDIQVRNKIYDSSINSWKKYENELDDIFKVLKN